MDKASGLVLKDIPIWCSTQVEEPISATKCCNDKDFCNLDMKPQISLPGMPISYVKVSVK